MKYDDFIAGKSATIAFPGIETDDIAKHLFPHQRDLVRWALRKGRSAVFADTGLGKTAIEIEWARHVSNHGRVLILAPLAVAPQTQVEATRFGVEVDCTKRDNGALITVANYENLHHFDPSVFTGVVLDESSILKSFNGKTRTTLVESFRETPFRLCATATPAPNDFTELGNHSEFLGVKTRTEMLAEYFVHDMDKTQDWRIKGHATTAFWRWIATWGAVVRTPADLGYDDTAYRLPPLRMHDIVVGVDHTVAWKSGALFAVNAVSLSEQRAIRRGTLDARVARAAEIAGNDGPCIVWCELNDESSALTDAIPGAVEIKGSDDSDTKAERLIAFSRGDVRVIVTKPSIAGFGLNWQHCACMVFVGASHSYEQTYQSIRRCWRFGQTRAVDVHVIRAETEQLIVDNYRRKEADAQRLGAEMAAMVGDAVRAEVIGRSVKEWNPYNANARIVIPPWLTSEGT